MKGSNEYSMEEAVRQERQERCATLDRELKRLFPEASIVLHYSSPWELLVAVMLSAQCTDKMVNEVTKTLFQKYSNLSSYVNADPMEFEQDIRRTGFFRNKTKHVLTTAREINERFGGTVPCTIEELTSLPGVARKTANIVLGAVYGVVEGIAVDTHVKRFAIRFDLTDHSDPNKIEQDLMMLVPKEDWYTFTYRVIEYGRQIAPARKYDTSKDPLVALYPRAGTRFRV